MLAASPRYLELRGTPRTIDDLKHHACLRYLFAGRPRPFSLADGNSILPEGTFDTDDGRDLLEAALKGAGITQFLRFAIEDDLATGRLNIVLPDLLMPTTPVHVLHPFECQLPLRVRLFIDFLVAEIGGFTAE